MTPRRLTTPGAARTGLLIGLALLAFGLVLAWQVTRIPAEAAYARIGPTLIPWLLVTMVVLLGVAILTQSALGSWKDPPAPASLDMRALAWVAAGLLINLITIEHVGFILASSALFLCVARGFGSTNPARDAALGFLLALAAYVGFDRVLGYQIGTGLVENLL